MSDAATRAEETSEGHSSSAIGLMVGAVGVCYGDIGTSPLYTLKEVFIGGYGVQANHDGVLGVLSLIFWSLVWVVSIKYVIFVLRADNQGEGGVMALSALARWTDSSLGRVSPDVFIGALEESGDIELLTRFVFRRALKQLGPLLREQRSFYVSVNVTGKDIADPGFIDFAMRQMARESVRPEQVALELTERTTEAQGCLLAGMNRLRELGLKIYVDDFGTGHSNLVYLANLPVDAIKIDKVFTQSIGDSSAVELIFDKLCSMAEHLEIGVVVEGIETQAQADHVLRRSPEALGQGWHFGKALPLEAFLDYYRNQPAGR